MKKNILIIISLVLIIIIGVVTWLIRQNQNTSTKVNVPQGIIIDEEYKQATQKMRIETADQAYKSSKVGGLLNVVPYQGNLFRFEYSYETGKFTVALQQGQLQQSSAEFDAFLKQNGVESQDWIDGLEVKLQ